MAEFVNNGDRVRVVIEGVHTGDPLEVGTFGPDRLFEVESTKYDDTVTVEKIEPPVVTFKPGDVVRDPDTEQVFLLIKGGYVQVAPTVGQANPLDWGNGVVEEFTSDLYERVSVTL